MGKISKILCNLNQFWVISTKVDWLNSLCLSCKSNRVIISFEKSSVEDLINSIERNKLGIVTVLKYFFDFSKN